MKYSNVYCLKSGYKLLILISFDPNRKNKIMSIPGRDIPSQRKKRTLLKGMIQMVICSFWLPNYMEYACKACSYRKKIDQNTFRSIFGTGYSIGISLHLGAFKKDMQQNSSIKLTFTSR